ncbi:hypothetical protein [Rufibacter quisquiliarum]|uniref:Uncharacterized protein n=1 Tax=Rufibacter quisquiliarum TaxID=1549639 RepID=A0A839GS45_9BACT|nr:hypothetical protein [Rufibacter quisquiliarum]MBA9078325.1 hypothetical protein [Rufibacter quisquiliarum]
MENENLENQENEIELPTSLTLGNILMHLSKVRGSLDAILTNQAYIMARLEQRPEEEVLQEVENLEEEFQDQWAVAFNEMHFQGKLKLPIKDQQAGEAQ